jgi:hypothetical protein
MDPDELKAQVAAWAADNPEGANVLRQQGAVAERNRMAAERSEALAAARSEGARAERERVAAIRATVPPGFSALADQLIESDAGADQAAHAVCAAVRLQQEQAQQTANAESMVAPFAGAPAEDAPKGASFDPFEVSKRARELVSAASASGSTMSVLAAVSQATAELSRVNP